MREITAHGDTMGMIHQGRKTEDTREGTESCVSTVYERTESSVHQEGAGMTSGRVHRLWEWVQHTAQLS